MKAPKFTAIVELLDPDIKRNQVGWCQIYSKGVPGSSDAEGWSVYPTPTSATIWSIQFLSPHVPVLGFLDRKIALHKADKQIGWVTIRDPWLDEEPDEAFIQAAKEDANIPF